MLIIFKGNIFILKQQLSFADLAWIFVFLAYYLPLLETSRPNPCDLKCRCPWSILSCMLGFILAWLSGPDCPSADGWAAGPLSLRGWPLPGASLLSEGSFVFFPCSSPCTVHRPLYAILDFGSTLNLRRFLSLHPLWQGFNVCVIIFKVDTQHKLAYSPPPPLLLWLGIP